ncbi:hypothetical protein QFZ24_000014 [Streptomyces phaeochromogenes]|jgi:hypothetical protein|nr:hypothetical protein [Streptomyces phaeochromogenes]
MRVSGAFLKEMMWAMLALCPAFGPRVRKSGTQWKTALIRPPLRGRGTLSAGSRPKTPARPWIMRVRYGGGIEGLEDVAVS